MRLGRDGISGLVVLAASLLLFWLTFGLKDSPLVPIGPGFYPRIVLGVTALFALLLVISDLRAQREGSEAPAASGAPAPPPPNYTLVVFNFALFGLYAAALPGLGFRVATFLYVAVSNAVLAPPRGLRGWARVLGLAAATALLTHLIFEGQLSVLLPRGRWTGF
ncbi:MAG: tripartite tricarboxylate transporter TctB family protein [Betaproteobacteria bacterium]|nr:tripartite tricarboxylate transporter TctB family protein [Betaproteobacteria bacterium]